MNLMKRVSIVLLVTLSFNFLIGPIKNGATIYTSVAKAAALNTTEMSIQDSVNIQDPMVIDGPQRAMTFPTGPQIVKVFEGAAKLVAFIATVVTLVSELQQIYTENKDKGTGENIPQDTDVTGRDVKPFGSDQRFNPGLSSNWCGYGKANAFQRVVDLQKTLNYRITSELVPDGSYGPKTNEAVLWFQRNIMNVTPDGSVGPATWRALCTDI